MEGTVPERDDGDAWMAVAGISGLDATWGCIDGWMALLASIGVVAAVVAEFRNRRPFGLVLIAEFALIALFWFVRFRNWWRRRSMPRPRLFLRSNELAVEDERLCSASLTIPLIDIADVEPLATAWRARRSLLRRLDTEYCGYLSLSIKPPNVLVRLSAPWTAPPSTTPTSYIARILRQTPTPPPGDPWPHISPGDSYFGLVLRVEGSPEMVKRWWLHRSKTVERKTFAISFPYPPELAPMLRRRTRHPRLDAIREFLRF